MERKFNRAIGPVKQELAASLFNMVYDVRFCDNPYLAEVKAKLQPGVNLGLYFNHQSLDDGPLAFLFHARKIDPLGQRHVVMIASHWHTDPQVNPRFAKISQIAQTHLGVEVIRVVQAYQINDPKYGYTEADAIATYRPLIKRMRELKAEKVPTTVIISPEGHRTDDGQMQKGRNGILHIGKMLSPFIYLPVGISFPRGYRRDELNTRLSKRVIQMAVGKPEYYSGQEEIGIDVLMNNLNNLGIV